MKLIAGNSNHALAQGISTYLGVPLTKTLIKRFPDQEIFVEVQENVRGEDVFLIQSTSYPANDHLMELLILIDTLKRSSAKRITAVMPYYGYARQDRKTGPRTPISAKLIANLLESAGAHRVLTLEFHTQQLQGFFDMPVDNLSGAVFIAKDLQTKGTLSKSHMIVAPDVGGLLRARGVASRLGLDVAVIDKRRDHDGQPEVIHIIGDVKGKHCILVDDIIDSGGTLCQAAEALAMADALSVQAYVVHGVLSGKALDRVADAPFDSLVLSDTITLSEQVRKHPKIRILSTADLLGEAIGRISREESISSLFQ